MSIDQTVVDALLAATLRGDDFAHNHRSVSEAVPGVILARVKYHGVAGLLRDLPEAMKGWPSKLIDGVRNEAVSLTMWELRHRHALSELLAELAAAKVVTVLLKGTALAYDLYRAPANRARGDSDILIDPANLATARSVLERLGFKRTGGSGELDDPFALQEVWTRAFDQGRRHHIDLHWQLLNCPALEGVFPVAECVANRMALPRLCPEAMGMDRARTLIHTCIHRMLNFTSPYFVGDRTYFGGDRLIWLNDIDLLARALSDVEWKSLVRLALEKGVAAACLEGLTSAQLHLATPFSTAVRDALSAASPSSQPAAYLRARQFGRAWLDLRATRGFWRKIGYARARALPSTAFIRNKYSQQRQLPVPILYARRMVDLFRARPTESSKR